jgi:hypothetical protein
MKRTPSNGDPIADRPRDPLVVASEPDDLSSHSHRQLVGSLGLALPLLLWLIAGLRPTEGLPRWGLLRSVSAYYYTGAVAAFVGTLVALAMFLVTYRGYDNEYRRRDRLAAIVAAAAAVLVAFFPGRAPADLPGPSWWTPRTGAIHWVSAVLLFSALSFFALFQFPKSKVGDGEPLPAGKRLRNGIYYLCGGVMAGCMVWAVIGGAAGKSIFWPEALALVSFAVSWLVKGRADRTAIAAGRRTVYYGRRPKELAADIWDAVRG